LFKNYFDIQLKIFLYKLYKRKAQRAQLQERINIRLDYEKAYIQAKQEDMDRELNEIKFKNEIANRRNEDLLNEIHKNVFRIFQSSKNINNSAESLYKEKKRYEEYSNYQLNSIKKEFFSRIQIKQHEILNIKTAFENQVDKNEEMFKLENLYNERMKKMLKDFSNNMNNLNDRNLKIAQDREEIIKNYISLENKTYEAINKIMDENKKFSDNKDLGIYANDFEKLVEKCINNINENLNKATSNANNNPKNITILIDNKPNQQDINKIDNLNRINLNNEKNIYNAFDNANENISIPEYNNNLDKKQNNESNLIIIENNKYQDNKGFNNINDVHNINLNGPNILDNSKLYILKCFLIFILLLFIKILFIYFDRCEKFFE